MALLYAYNFDEASGNILDQSGNGRDTVFGGSLSRSASGHTSKGLTQTSAAAESAGPSLTGLQTAQFTMMFWFFRTSNSQVGWVGQLKDAGSGDRGFLFISGNVRGRARNSGGTAGEVIAAEPSINNWHHGAVTYDGTKVHLFLDGVESGTGSTLAAPLKTTSTSSHLLDTLGAETIIDDLRYYDAALDAATITTLMGQPVTAGGTTGTVAITQANQTSTASGQLGYTGTSARTQAANTSTATGTVVNPVTGTAAASQAAQTASAAGTFTAGGAITGSAAVTQANQTSAATGQLGYSGTSARTQASQSSTASGKLGYGGTVARTQANNTAAASGTVSSPVTGVVAATQANQVASITGYFAGLVAFGTASAAVGQASTAATADGQASTAAAATAGSATASSGSMAVPTATGG